MISKQNVSSNKSKHVCSVLLTRILLYTFGIALVVILIISAILPLLIYLLIGDYRFDEQIDKEYRLSVKHSNE